MVNTGALRTQEPVIPSPSAPRHRVAVPGAGIPPSLVAVMAVACGLSVANIYYAQPLLHAIAADLGVGSDTAGLVVTGSQVGYAAGLALLVPLGDVLVRRRLVPGVLLVATVALVGMAAAPTAPALIAAAAMAGLGSVATQILIPMAAGLATDADRGRVVGIVMAGLLLGILLARTLAGAISDAAGWRSVFAVAAVIMAAQALVLARVLPTDPPRIRLGYARLQRSTLAVARAEPLLRRRTLLGALNLAAFSVYWTTMAFVLAEPPFDFGDAVIGLFGLAGAAGALAGVGAGRFADRGWTRATSLVSAGLVTASFPVLWAGRESLAAMVLGVLLLDLGVQGLQVTNQSLIYTLRPEARSRVTSFYMVGYFAGGALGSAAGAVVYARWGWGGVCVTGAGVGAAAMTLLLRDRRRPHPPAPAMRGPAAP